MEPLILGTSPSGEIDRIVDECLEPVLSSGQGPNLGFIYTTDHLASRLPQLVPRLRERSGIRHWVGTVGVGICTTGCEHYDAPATAILAGRFPSEGFRIIPSLGADTRPFVEPHRTWLRGQGGLVGIVHGDPTVADTPQALEGLNRALPEAFFAGGLTSSAGTQYQVAGEVGSGGLSGVLFSSRVPITVTHTQGCTPIGCERVITRAQRNVLIELEGRPALEVLKEDIGEVLSKDLQRAAGYIFAGLPVPDSRSGDYVVRNLLGFDATRGLVAIGEEVSEGQSVLFCRRDGNSARDDLLRMLAQTRRRLGELRPRGALYFSCLARGRHQFGEHSEELGMIRDELGPLPLIGFFANGEIYHHRLYGYTGVLAVFS